MFAEVALATGLLVGVFIAEFVEVAHVDVFPEIAVEDLFLGVGGCEVNSGLWVLWAVLLR